MRRLLLLTVVLAACSGRDTATTDTAAADTMAAAAPAPAALTAQDLAGTFTGTSHRLDADTAVSTWTMVTTVGADNAVTSRLVFAGSTDSIAVRLVAIEGDSVRWEIGPYKLGGRPNGPEVNTMLVGRKTADGFAGTYMAHPVAKPDSVIAGRWESRRAM